MGRLQAEEMAALADIDTALVWHLTSNHYPPLPALLLGPAKEAIAALEEGDTERDIDLRGIAAWRGSSCAPAWACVEGWHLDAFIDTNHKEQ